MKTAIVKIDASEYGLEEKQSTEITKNLTPILNEREIMMANYERIIKQEINPETVKEARETRLLIQKNRTQGILSWHKVNKEFFLRGGQFLDAIKRKEIEVNERAEAQLLAIEQHLERIEEKRVNDLRDERVELLEPYGTDTTLVALGHMNDEAWDLYFIGVKAAHQIKMDEEKKVEADRIAKEKAEQEERERISKENEQLRKEAEEKEKVMQAERKKAEVERKALEEKARKEREAAEAKAKKEAEEKEKIQVELQAKKDAEEKAIKDSEEAKKKSELAPDKEKLCELIDTINAIEMPELETDNAVEIVNGVNNLLDKVVSYIEAKSKGL